jgi:hypothetical protein
VEVVRPQRGDKALGLMAKRKLKIIKIVLKKGYFYLLSRAKRKEFATFFATNSGIK